MRLLASLPTTPVGGSVAEVRKFLALMITREESALLDVPTVLKTLGRHAKNLGLSEAGGGGGGGPAVNNVTSGNPAGGARQKGARNANAPVNDCKLCDAYLCSGNKVAKSGDVAACKKACICFNEALAVPAGTPGQGAHVAAARALVKQRPALTTLKGVKILLKAADGAAAGKGAAGAQQGVTAIVADPSSLVPNIGGDIEDAALLRRL